MRKGKKAGLVRLTIMLGIVLLALLSVTVVHMLFVFPGGHPVLRSSREADLRQVDLTVEQYQELTSELPDCYILWMIPIGGSRYDSTASEITIDAVTAGDISLFRYFDNLQRVNALNSESYAELACLRQLLPECDVDWAIHLGNAAFSPASEEIVLNGTGVTVDELTDKLSLFTELCRVSITDTSISAEDQMSLSLLYPDVVFEWNVIVDGHTFLSTDTSLRFAGDSIEPSVLIALADSFYSVDELDLSGCNYSIDELLAIQAAYGAFVRTELTLFNITFPTDSVELDFSNIPMDNTDAVEQILPLMPQLEKVIMCDCGIPSEEMDALGKRNPNVRFVWTVQIGRARIRTDETAFIGAKHGYLPDARIRDPHKDAYRRLFDEDCVEFKYCIDMVCLDLGHHGITDYSFLQYMPNLKYLILADTQGTDFSVVGNLTELIYLEVFMTKITDISFLLNLKKLENLNLGFTKVTDVETLKQMTWVDMLWIPGTPITAEQYAELKAALPNTVMDYGSRDSTSNGWRTCQNYYDMRDYLGMYYLN